MQNNQKQAIQAKLAGFCRLKGSAQKASRALRDVSTATISQVINGNWENISDDMWRGIASQIGYDPNQWMIAETRGYNKMTRLLEEVQEFSLVMAIIGDAGCGKSQAIKSYINTHKNAYHLCCSEYWNRKQFLLEIQQAAGLNFTGPTVAAMVDDIIYGLLRKDRPIIILDEVDKLPDQVLYFFITLYNKLEDRCGILLCSTDYFAKRLTFGERISKKGYKEIYSRIGRKFVSIPVARTDDVAAICQVNGITDEDQIRHIAEDSERDLRRVKRLIHATKRQLENENN